MLDVGPEREIDARRDAVDAAAALLEDGVAEIVDDVAVAARAALQPIGPGAAVENVRARAPVTLVVAGARLDVRGFDRRDLVVAAAAGDHGRRWRACLRIVGPLRRGRALVERRDELAVVVVIG